MLTSNKYRSLLPKPISEYDKENASKDLKPVEPRLAKWDSGDVAEVESANDQESLATKAHLRTIILAKKMPYTINRNIIRMNDKPFLNANVNFEPPTNSSPATEFNVAKYFSPTHKCSLVQIHISCKLYKDIKGKKAMDQSVSDALEQSYYKKEKENQDLVDLLKKLVLYVNDNNLEVPPEFAQFKTK